MWEQGVRERERWGSGERCNVRGRGKAGGRERRTRKENARSEKGEKKRGREDSKLIRPVRDKNMKFTMQLI